MQQKNNKICVICGALYPCPPSDMVKTCGKKCSSKLRQNNHLENKYNQEHMHQKARERAANDPRLARGSEQHYAAKKWVIQSPDGQVYKMSNLLQWLREHEDILDGTAMQAWDGITKIKYSAQGKRKNPSYTWKGWTLLEWDN